MTRSILIAALFCLPGWLHSQDSEFISIHQEQSEYYNQFSGRDALFFDSLHGFYDRLPLPKEDSCQLQKLVFGFHPYWMGSAYLNYQWGLLSDLCYFSYEVEPSTGHPATIHDWLTDPSIDSAHAHGVRTHLCATLFSGHYTFFGNPDATQNLINNLISLVQQRNASGINIDFEAVPSSLGDDVTAFMIDLAGQFHSLMPEGILSIDIPAVDWGDVFDIDALKNDVDLFFVMGYDYYWNGSGTAGPVGPLYSMTDVYNYSLCRTVSSYQSKGLPQDKFLLGLPYYGRVWKTLSNTVPSGTIGYGTALTYANVRNNSGGNFFPGNYFWDGNSFSSCYIFYQNDDWNQCFIGLEKDLRKRYDQVNYRGLAGIGIWALGYDNGYTELWDAIRDRFTNCASVAPVDTVYDCGGPTWDYYNLEDYWITLQPHTQGLRMLDFRSFDTEAGYDSLHIYSGTDSALNLLGSYSGSVIPPVYSSQDGIFTLHFHSDGLTTAAGWEAIWHDGTLDAAPLIREKSSITIYPNPFRDHITIIIEAGHMEDITLHMTDLYGRNIFLLETARRIGQGGLEISAEIPWHMDNVGGIYFLKVEEGNRTLGSIKLLRMP